MLVNGEGDSVEGVTVTAWSINLVAEGEQVFEDDLTGGPAENVQGLLAEPLVLPTSPDFVSVVNVALAERASVEATVEAVIQVPLEDMPLLAAVPNLALLQELVFHVVADTTISVGPT